MDPGLWNFDFRTLDSRLWTFDFGLRTFDFGPLTLTVPYSTDTLGDVMDNHGKNPKPHSDGKSDPKGLSKRLTSSTSIVTVDLN